MFFLTTGNWWEIVNLWPGGKIDWNLLHAGLPIVSRDLKQINKLGARIDPIVAKQ